MKFNAILFLGIILIGVIAIVLSWNSLTVWNKNNIDNEDKESGMSDKLITSVGSQEFAITPPDGWTCYKFVLGGGDIEQISYRSIACVEGQEKKFFGGPFSIWISFSKDSWRNVYGSVEEASFAWHSFESSPDSTKNIIIDGEPAVLEETSFTDGRVSLLRQQIIKFLHNGLYYEIVYDTTKNDRSGLEAFQKIVESFRFQ